MKTLCLVLVLLGCSLCANSARAFFGDPYKFETNVTQKADLPGGLKSLEVHNQFGPLRVTGTESGAGEWSWNLKIKARTAAAAKEAAETATIKVEHDGDRLRLVVWLPDTDGKVSFESDLEVRAPKSVLLRTENRFAATHVSNFSAEVDSRGQNGPIEVSKVVGKVRAETTFSTLKVSDVGPAVLHNQNGPMDVSDIHGPLEATTSFATLTAHDIAGPVKLRNQNGAVDLSNANETDVKTSFAELKVKEINGNAKLANQNGSIKGSDINGDVKATTSFATLDVRSSGKELICHNQNGPVIIRATTAVLANIEAQTSFASMEVHVPAKLKPAVAAKTTFADVESDFPVIMKKGNPFSGLEPGTPRIKLENQNGAIRVVGD